MCSMKSRAQQIFEIASCLVPGFVGLFDHMAGALIVQVFGPDGTAPASLYEIDLSLRLMLLTGLLSGTDTVTLHG